MYTLEGVNSVAKLHSFEIIEPILVILKIEYHLSRRKRGRGVRMQPCKLQCCI